MHTIKKSLRVSFGWLLLSLLPQAVVAQQEKGDLGDKEYIIVKDYRPVLAESAKISDTPEGDTSTFTAPPMQYNLRSKKAETNYETAVIKAVKVKDEPLPKLYRSLVRGGVGNYTSYLGELYINSLRSKTGSLGLALRHLSASPNLKDAGPADFSDNSAMVYGKYFLENATFDGRIRYDRNVVHYYGYDKNDTVIDKKDSRQQFGKFGVDLGFGSSEIRKDRINYQGRFGFSTLSDNFAASENEIRVGLEAGKQVNDLYVNLPVSMEFFKKKDAEYQVLSLLSNQSRNIVRLRPEVRIDREKIRARLGLGFELEKNKKSEFHIFPRFDITAPIADQVLYAFVGADGAVVKNNFHTLAEENPFITSAIIPLNTIEKLNIRAGMRGNFSSTIGFTAGVRYSTIENLQLFYNDLDYFNKFNVLYDDAKVLNLNAEVIYKSNEKFALSLHVDQYNYKMDTEAEAWFRPNTEVALRADYNFRDKILVNAAIFARGPIQARTLDANGAVAEKINGWIDANLGVEYKYSKILSGFVRLNNLGFSRYYYWYRYQSMRFNVMAGVAYSF
ncbi:hypothetical protein [Candidatus Pollutiaquabacter sp.]|uniref:hypothetical protein n=1 Tax=Candidatus Pollutiaquabacter sp. TaxID=3416354 RepID=UPI003C9E55A2|nr:hypothetical protein [Bacteroidota bacterium]